MGEQRISRHDFWSRYGHQEFDETDFAKALARLPKLTADGPWLAGGSVRRLITQKPQDSDFDFFFRDEEQFSTFCDAIKAGGGKKVSESDFNITFRVPAAEPRLVDDDKFEGGGPELKVQAIRIAFHDTLESVLDSFDFSICQTGYDGTDFLFGQWTLFDIANKRLVPGTLRYGTSSLRRIIKYTRQGFTICGGGLADVLQQVVDNPEIIQREVEYVD